MIDSSTCQVHRVDVADLRDKYNSSKQICDHSSEVNFPSNCIPDIHMVIEENSGGQCIERVNPNDCNLGESQEVIGRGQYISLDVPENFLVILQVLTGLILGFRQSQD